jgi:hypothetical protein
MVISGVNPHGLSDSGHLESALFIEADGSAIRYQDLLVKLGILLLKFRNDFCTNAPTMMGR